MRRLVLVLVAILGWLHCTAMADSEATTSAALYLRAWQYKDYSAMFSMSAPTARGASEAEYMAAAAAMAAPATGARVATTSIQADGVHAYFEAAGAPIGSIVIRPDGVLHPELVGRLRASVPTSNAPSAAPTSTKTIDGETADSILEKMNKVTESAQALRANVSIKGMMLGQSMSQSGKLVFQNPNKFRLQMPDFVMNSTSGTNVLYMPQANVYMELNSIGDFELAPGLGTPAAELREKYSITLQDKRQYAGRSAFVLSMKPPSAGLGGMLGSNRIKLYVDAQTWLPMCAEMDTMKLEYTNVRLNPDDIRDEEFVFKPPAGATRLSLGNLLTGMGGL